MKQLKILEFALAALLRRKFKNFAILAMFSFTVAILSSVLSLTHALKEETAYILQDVPDLIVQRVIGGRHDLIPLQYRKEVAAIRGVTGVEPRYWGYYYDALTRANYTLIGTGGTTANLTLLDGHLPAESGQSAIGLGVAEMRGSTQSGELILVNSKNTGVLYEVSGIFRSESRLLTNDLVVLTDDDIIRFFGYPDGQATDLVVTVPNSNEIQTVAAKIKKILPDTRPITKRELIRTYDMVFNWRSGMMLTVFSAAVIAFCIIAWDKATGISGEEKQEIGILKAVGWDTADVLALKFWEGLSLSLLSLLTGLILSYIHIALFNGVILSSVIRGWSVLFPGFQIEPSFPLYHIWLMTFCTIVPYVASTVIPTWKTAITDPDSVMRG